MHQLTDRFMPLARFIVWVALSGLVGLVTRLIGNPDGDRTVGLLAALAGHDALMALFWSVISGVALGYAVFFALGRMRLWMAISIVSLTGLCAFVVSRVLFAAERVGIGEFWGPTAAAATITALCVGDMIVRGLQRRSAT